jgi:hypothetical protein
MTVIIYTGLLVATPPRDASGNESVQAGVPVADRSASSGPDSVMGKSVRKRCWLFTERREAMIEENTGIYS